MFTINPNSGLLEVVNALLHSEDLSNITEVGGVE